MSGQLHKSISNNREHGKEDGGGGAVKVTAAMMKKGIVTKE
jgi:hypothetical protein